MSETPQPRLSLRDVLAQIRRRLPLSSVKPPIGRPTSDEVAAQRARDQVELIRRAFREVGEVAAAGPEGPYVAKDDAEARYLYQPGVALVRDDTEERRYFEEFTEFFSRRDSIFEGRAPVRREDIPLPEGLVMVEMPSRSDEADAVLRTLEEIDQDRRERNLEGVVAQPNHVLYVTREGSYCPATEPEVTRVDEPVPARSTDMSIGAEVKVSVVDTGLWVPATEPNSGTDWLTGVTPADALDAETVDQNDIHEYAGHGTFVAGIIKCLAPGVTIEVEGALPHGGAAYEHRIVEELREALENTTDPQLISISAGTHTRDNLGLLGFEILAENHGLDGTKGLVIAAAGNDSSSDPFYPAAFPWVISVGALDEEGNVADYSNYGCWVDVWARGSNLVNAFPPGTYVCKETPNKGQVRHFKHLAQWSGTSFSTPIVTAAIAAQMSATKNYADPQRAFDEINAAAPKCKDKIASGRKHVGPL